MTNPKVSDFYPVGFDTDPTCPLDMFFGEARPPTRIQDEERLQKPSSLTVLDVETSQLISTYLETAKDGLGISRVAHEMLPILWVLDETGMVSLALEEVLEKGEEGRKFPLAREIDVPSDFYKLGHPSLVSDASKKARIGGELLYDPDPDNDVEGWVITNASGRYGFGENRESEHLENVKEVFYCYGIEVSTFYIERRQ